MPTGRSLLALTLASWFLSCADAQCLSKADDDNFKGAKMTLFEATDFGLDLFKELFPYNETRNFVFSPYSIWNMLALAYLGAEGKTEQELRSALKVDSKVTVLKKWTSIEYIYKIRQMSSEDLKFKVSTKAFVEEKLNLRECMKHILADELDLLQLVDFSMTNESALTINNFVSDTTDGRISDMVSPDDLETAKMVFVSAAYFKDFWKKTFKASKTKEELFYISVQNISLVQMMRQKGYFRHGMSEEIGAHVLELPYSLKEISMLIFLPPFISGEVGFNRMIEKLSGATLKRAVEDIWMGQLQVVIPKFRIDASYGEEIMTALQNLGIRDLFDADRANLTSFVEGGALSVQKTLHKAFITVSEEGTEAAGAGVAIAMARSSRPFSEEAFECNHPFAFVIYDKLLDNVLFLGAYKSPDKIIRIT